MDRVSEITVLLGDLAADTPGSFDRLVPLVYDELRQMARRQLGGRGGARGGATLNTHALVHEAYLKLSEGSPDGIVSRDQFLRLCAVVMRNVVIDAVRRRQAAKRGGGGIAVTFNEELFAMENQAEDLLALDQALVRLEDYDPILARVVECRYFAGLTEPETAGALGIGERTVRRHWVQARTLLQQILAS